MNVTYIFGAGASAGVLPLVKDIPLCLVDFAEEFVKAVKKDELKPDQIQNLVEDIYWLYDETKKSSSVDTFAKRLSFRGETDKLTKLKTVLSLYFIYTQANRQFYEKRYDAFFAAILNGSYENLPKSIKIVSWNYDSQFELAFNEYSQLNSLKQNQEKLRVYNKLLNNAAPIDRHNFGIFKLNGTASFFKDNDFLDLLFDPRSKSINFIADCYSKSALDKEIYQAISFAWEKVPKKESYITTGALDCVSDTDILVVIGYSFPDFNRDIDTAILNAMQQVETVVIQDKNPYLIKDRLIATRPDFGYVNNYVKIIETDAVDYFYIPHQYKQSL